MPVQWRVVELEAYERLPAGSEPCAPAFGGRVSLSTVVPLGCPTWAFGESLASTEATVSCS